MIKSRDMLKELVHRLAMTVRIGVETNDFTVDEAMDFIRTESEKEFNTVMNLSTKELAVVTLREIVNSIAEDAMKERD